MALLNIPAYVCTLSKICGHYEYVQKINTEVSQSAVLKKYVTGNNVYNFFKTSYKRVMKDFFT